MDNQAPGTVLMIRPLSFGFNPETHESNPFQKNYEGNNQVKLQGKALKEFNKFVKVLRDEGVNVVAVDDTIIPPKPDAVFPNNWVSFHQDGTVVLYPMRAENRRVERRTDVIYNILKKQHFDIKKVIDLTVFEKEGKFLEGTGSIVFDYQNRIAYSVLSPRTDASLFSVLCNELEYKACLFNATDKSGHDIYHTNVLMCVGSGYVVICLDVIRNTDQRNMLTGLVKETNHEIIEITIDQMYSFAGNMIELNGAGEKKILVMSKKAYNSLEESQINQLSRFVKPVYADIQTIETFGGGSARCMMAGIFLPKLPLKPNPVQ